jgi:hypothetical protein
MFNILKTVPKTVTTTRTEDGHKQNTKTSTALQTERKKEHGETEKEMEGPTSSGGLRNRLTRQNLHEHDDDDDECASVADIEYRPNCITCSTSTIHCVTLITKILALYLVNVCKSRNFLFTVSSI